MALAKGTPDRLTLLERAVLEEHRENPAHDIGPASMCNVGVCKRLKEGTYRYVYSQ